jgi:hypothetical protein
MSISSLQVDRLCLQRQPLRMRRGTELVESGGVAIDGQRLEPALCQPDRVPAATTRHVERRAGARQEMLMIDEPTRRLHLVSRRG